MSAPTLQPTPGDDASILGVIQTGIDQIRSTLGASGALIALRDHQFVRLLASVGHVPALGSSLHLESDFTHECLRTGRVLLRNDAMPDSRINVRAVPFVRLRSALAVPVNWNGLCIGVIQIFSPQVSAFHGAHIEVLQEVSRLFAPILWSESQRLARASVERLAAGAEEVETLVLAAQGSVLTEAEEPEVRPPEPESPSFDLKPPAPSVSAPVIALKAYPWLPSVARLRDLVWQTTFGRTVLLGVAASCAVLILFAVVSSVQRKTMEVPQTASARRSAGVAAPTQLNTPRRAPIPAIIPGATPQDTVPATAPSSPSIVSFLPRRESNASSESAPPKTLAALSQNPVDTPSPSPQSSLNTLISSVPAAAAPFVALQSSANETAPSSAAALAPLSAEVAVETSASSNASPSAEALPPPSASPALLGSKVRPDFVLTHTVKGHSGWVTGVAFTSDGRRLMSGSWDRTVKLWDVPTAAEVKTMDGESKQVEALACSRDGHWLAAENSSDSVNLWDASTGQLSRVFPTDKRLTPVGSNWVYSIAFSPDARLLASAVDDRTIRLWNVESGAVVRDLTSHRRPVIYIAFSPDGRWLVSGDDEKTILIWNVSTGEPVRKLVGHKKVVYSVAFSPDGHWLASASADKTIKLWDVELGREAHTFTGHNGMVTSLAFSPDGRWLASGSWDKTIRIWDVQNGTEVQTLSGQSHSVYAVAFDSRGRYLASGNEDGTINFWRWKSP